MCFQIACIMTGGRVNASHVAYLNDIVVIAGGLQTIQPMRNDMETSWEIQGCSPTQTTYASCVSKSGLVHKGKGASTKTVWAGTHESS